MNDKILTEVLIDYDKKLFDSLKKIKINIQKINNKMLIDLSNINYSSGGNGTVYFTTKDKVLKISTNKNELNCYVSLFNEYKSNNQIKDIFIIPELYEIKLDEPISIWNGKNNSQSNYFVFIIMDRLEPLPKEYYWFFKYIKGLNYFKSAEKFQDFFNYMFIEDPINLYTLNSKFNREEIDYIVEWSKQAITIINKLNLKDAYQDNIMMDSNEKLRLIDLMKY